MDRPDKFSPKHTLDQYARLAAYARVDALERAKPATWIRHTLRQLDAKGGRYRRITAEARRDWHRVLEYNRHDLLALRHIHLIASRELALWRAYERTRFCVDDGARRVCFKAGSRSSRLDALLTRHGATRWAFITAWNPGSVTLSPAENARRHAELKILSISHGKALSLGRRFGQLAIVVGRRGEAARLVPGR